MTDIINYFIGAFNVLFSFVNPIWSTDYGLRLAFVIIVSVMCAITLLAMLFTVKSVLSVITACLRGD